MTSLLEIFGRFAADHAAGVTGLELFVRQGRIIAQNFLTCFSVNSRFPLRI